MPVVKNREYRTMIQTLAPSQDAANDKRIDTDYYVEGYATTFDAPYEVCEIDGIRYFEVIERGALDGANLSDVIMQYDHSGKVLARLSNRTLGLDIDEHGLLVFADLSKSRAAQELHEEIKNGLVTKMSWCFVILDEEYNRETRTRHIKKISKVYDVSAVSIPANADTDISVRSNFYGLIEVEKREALAQKKRRLLLKIKLIGV